MRRSRGFPQLSALARASKRTRLFHRMRAMRRRSSRPPPRVGRHGWAEAQWLSPRRDVPRPRHERRPEWLGAAPAGERRPASDAGGPTPHASELQGGDTVRLHFRNAEANGPSPVGDSRLDARRAELEALFTQRARASWWSAVHGCTKLARVPAVVPDGVRAVATGRGAPVSIHVALGPADRPSRSGQALDGGAPDARLGDGHRMYRRGRGCIRQLASPCPVRSHRKRGWVGGRRASDTRVTVA